MTIPIHPNHQALADYIGWTIQAINPSVSNGEPEDVGFELIIAKDNQQVALEFLSRPTEDDSDLVVLPPIK